MQRFRGLSLLLGVAAAAGAALNTQQTSRKAANVLPRRYAYLVPFTPSVSGLPFSAQYVIQIEEPQAGASGETWHSTTLVARDADGRIRRELHDYVPVTFTKEPPLFGVMLTDPVSRLRHTLDPVLQTDDLQWFHVPKPDSVVIAGAGDQDLGSKIMDGLEVKGLRRSWTRPAPASASGRPEQVVDETWYSNELQIIVLKRQTDSLGGEMTVSLAHLDRGTPAPSLFKAPRGYHPPSQHNHMSATPSLIGGTIPGADVGQNGNQW